MVIRDVDVQKTFCLSGLLCFTRFFFKERTKRRFAVGRHHKIISDALDRVLRGECRRLMINIAPRYSKTELAVKNFVAMGLALNPRAKFIHLSYSDDLARDNSSEVQAIMHEPMYQRLFGVAPTSTSSKKWTTPEGGGLYAVSSAGQVTGFGAGLVDLDDTDTHEIDDTMEQIAKAQSFGGAIIIDDPIKPDDALSATIRDKVNAKFDTTIRNRVNSRNTPIIIIMQRLHADDLCGHLLAQEGDEWEVVSLPTIYTNEQGQECALWEFKHTLKELHELRAKNPFVFDTQYMQDPKPLEGLMYERGFRTYEVIPTSRRSVRKMYIDTADKGVDYLCAITYDETETANYVLDVLYTQKPMEVTESLVAEMILKYSPKVVYIESNNGGRSFARKVEELIRLRGNTITEIRPFTQSDNKQARIFTHSASVQNMVYMPLGWERTHFAFASALLGYLKAGKNAHDDAPDALTGTIEKRDKGQGISDGDILNIIL